GDGLGVLAQRQALLVRGGGHVVEEFGRRPFRFARIAGQQPVGGVDDIRGRDSVEVERPERRLFEGGAEPDGLVAGRGRGDEGDVRAGAQRVG
ncbi:hypothetical protein, partial [Streptomyces sp. JJ66]|uniref:hypothetical protein n=1 Tax=Streptomyces sp. JJ66 TaxID=2803843 RepID=UPI001C56EA32